MSYGDEPFHTILDKPWEYSIERFSYIVDASNWRDSYIDLHLRKGHVLRHLRFLGPTDLEIEKGCFPEPTHGMCFVDISRRQLEDASVWVTDFEGTHGAVRFYASKVIDMDQE